MIDFYYSATPNGWKIGIMLEECQLDYKVHLIRLTEGDQFRPEFLKINPNAKMPAILDHGVDGDPVPVFESGAILIYLAEKPASSHQLIRKAAKRCMSGYSGRLATLVPWPASTATFATMHRRAKPTV